MSFRPDTLPLSGTFLTVWEAITAISIIASAFIVPLSLVLTLTWYSHFYFITSLIYVVSALCTFFIPRQLSEISQEKGTKSISVRFNMSIVFDIIAAFPFVFFSDLFEPHTGILLCATAKLVNIITLPQHLSAVDTKIPIHFAVLRMVKFIIFVAIFIHIIAVGWLYIGAPLGVAATVIPTEGDKYIRALYWCITTFATIGYGDITPDKSSSLEVIFTCIAMVLGVGVYGYTIGNITSIITSLDRDRENYKRTSSEIREFCKVKQIPTDLQKKMERYYDFVWQSHVNTDEDKLMARFPESLRLEVVVFLNKSTVQKVPFFSGLDTLYVTEIIKNMQKCTFLPGDYVYHEGEYSCSMFFITAGRFLIEEKNENQHTVLEAGDFFGEAALISEQKRTNQVISLTYSDVYVLSKEFVDTLRSTYSDFNNHMSIRT